MNSRSYNIPIKQRKLLAQVGEQIKLARRRRKYSESLVAKRAGIARSTLVKIEKGSPVVSLGMYLMVLHALGMGDDILLLARDDEYGRKIQDADLMVNKSQRRKISE